MNMSDYPIPGEPTGKATPCNQEGWGAYTHPEKTVLYENLVRPCYPGGMFEGCISQSVTAHYAYPKILTKKNRELMLNFKMFPTKKPDCDNVLKNHSRCPERDCL